MSNILKPKQIYYNIFTTDTDTHDLFELIASASVGVPGDDFNSNIEKVQKVIANMLMYKLTHEHNYFEVMTDELECAYENGYELIFEIYKRLLSSIRYCQSKHPKVLRELVYNLGRHRCTIEVSFCPAGLSPNSIFISFVKGKTN